MDSEAIPQAPKTRWQVFRDVLVFQFKLLIDGLRDAILIPVSLIAALFGLITNSSHPGQPFYRVVAWGKSTEQWINLFGMSEHNEEERGFPVRPLDQVIQDLERSVVAQYEQGGLTATAKKTVDGALDSLQRLRKGSSNKDQETN